MQKCEDWLSDKINDGTGNDKWWRLDQVLRLQCFGFTFQIVHNTSFMQTCFINYCSTSLHWIAGLGNWRHQAGTCSHRHAIVALKLCM